MNYTEEFNNAYAELEKAIRDRSHLTQKVITDKNGHTRKVWVNPLDKEQMKKRKADIADFRDFTGYEKEKADFETIFKDVLGDNIIKMRSIPSIDKTGETNFYMIDVDYDKSKDKIDGAKEKIKAALKEKGYELDGDISEKHFDAHWQYSTHYPAEHRFAFHVKNDSKSNDKITKEFNRLKQNIAEKKDNKETEKSKSSGNPIEDIKGKRFSVAQFQQYSFENKDGKWYLEHHSDTGNRLGNAGDITVNKDGSITLHGYATYGGTVADKNGDYAKKNHVLREISVKFSKEELANPDSRTFRNKLNDYRSGFSFSKDFTIKKV